MRRLVLIVPLPRKDRDDHPVPVSRHRQASDLLLKSFARWFRGSTVLPSWASWKGPKRSLSIDRGQTVVLVMTTGEVFRKRRRELTRLLERIGRALNQDQMVAMAFGDEAGSLRVSVRP